MIEMNDKMSNIIDLHSLLLTFEFFESCLLDNWLCHSLGIISNYWINWISFFLKNDFMSRGDFAHIKSSISATLCGLENLIPHPISSLKEKKEDKTHPISDQRCTIAHQVSYFFCVAVPRCFQQAFPQIAQNFTVRRGPMGHCIIYKF